MASTPAPQTCKRTVNPLTCTVCVKKPTFSDLSHLLTHISSKAHLSTYYKFKIRANSGEEASRQLITDYDLWYATNDIETLMSDRLNQKEERNRIKTEPGFSRPNVIKKEAKPRTITPLNVPAAVSDAALPYTYPNPYVAMAPMYNFQAPYGYTIQAQEPVVVDGDEEEDSLDMASVTGPHKRKNRGKARAPDGEPIDIDEDESSKLKGVYWPGMGLFDAASPEHKKMRNQKKDVSVNDRLAAMSEVIEKNEMVFSPGGSLSKVREISGVPVSDAEPLPGEEAPPRPPKAKRAPRRKVLASLDPNANLNKLTGARGKKRGRKAKPVVAATPEPMDESDHDIDLNLSAHRNRRRKTYVHLDEDDQAGEDSDGQVTFEQPAAMNNLTAGYTYAPVYQQPTAAMGFRPAEANIPGQAYYQFPTGHGNPFPNDIAASTTWDLFHGMGGYYLGNPLFIMHPSSDDDEEQAKDDEGTISAPETEND